MKFFSRKKMIDEISALPEVLEAEGEVRDVKTEAVEKPADTAELQDSPTDSLVEKVSPVKDKELPTKKLAKVDSQAETASKPDKQEDLSQLSQQLETEIASLNFFKGVKAKGEKEEQRFQEIQHRYDALQANYHQTLKVKQKLERENAELSDKLHTKTSLIEKEAKERQKLEISHQTALQSVKADLEQEKAQLKAELGQALLRLYQEYPTKESLDQALKAQKTESEKLKAEAEKEVQDLKLEAQKQAQQILSQAEAKAESLVQEGQDKLTALMAKLEAYGRQLEAIAPLVEDTSAQTEPAQEERAKGE